jgi:hypothetical protein
MSSSEQANSPAPSIKSMLEAHAATCRIAMDRGEARPPFPAEIQRAIDVARSRGERVVVTGGDFRGARFDGCSFVGCSFDGCSFVGCIFDDCSFVGSSFDGSRFVGCSFDGSSVRTTTGLPTQAGKGGPPETAEQKSARLAARAERCRRRAAEFRAQSPDVPVVESLDRKILDSLDRGCFVLHMGSWHGRTDSHPCGTTHCRAGAAITEAGDAGRALESRLGSAAAGALIYLASTGRVPNFYATNEAALADLRECAGLSEPPADEASR